MPGAWGHAIGGMGAITQAMARACREAGVEILLKHPVEEVIVDQGPRRRCGRRRQGWRAKTVVAGVNPKLLFDRLVPEGAVDARVSSADARLEMRKRDLPDERRAVRTAEVHASCPRRAII